MTPLLVTIIIAIVGSSGLWNFLQYIIDVKIKKKKQTLQSINDKLETVVNKEDLDVLHREVHELKDDLHKDKELTKSLARDRLNALCNKYIKEGFIPLSDYASFKEIGASYIESNGNSEVKTKFEFCMENLDVINPSK